MLLIPGIVASSYFAPQGDFDSIATVAVGSGGTATVEFASIPSLYQHLQVRFIATGEAATPALYMWVGTTTSGYVRHRLQGNGSSAISDAATSQSYMTLFGSNGLESGSTTNVGIIDILDYQNTNKNKTFRCLAGIDDNGSGTIELTSFLHPSTAAIDKLSFQASSGDIAQYSHFALYGIKG